MGFIPNSIVEIFTGIPLKRDYEDTYLFTSLATQNMFFTNLSKLAVLNEQYRVEPDSSSIKIEKKYSQVYKANYMRFKNTDYENKWFYCFITKVEYVNEETSRIYYEADVMQTWLPNVDYKLGECYVEREHSATDGIGDNLMPEAIALSPYIINSVEELTPYTDEADFYYILAIADTEMSQPHDKLYSPAALLAFRDTPNELAILKNLIMLYSETPEKILSLYTAPAISVVHRTDLYIVDMQGGGKFESLSGIDSNTRIDGYRPRNKKLLTFPYNYLELVTPDTAVMELCYELFYLDVLTDTGTERLRQNPNFRWDCCIGQPVQATVRPVRYGGVNDPFNPNMDLKISLVDYPVCTWSTDAYREWLYNGLTQTAITGLTKILGGGAAAVMTMGTSELVGAASGAGVVTSLVNTVGDMAKGYMNASLHDVKTAGVQKTTNTDFLNGRMKVYAYRKSINRECAISIDDFFQKYGYACRKVKVPNIDAREKWCYTKTIGCQLEEAHIPVEDEEKIQSIFDNGIRFWIDKYHMGYYYTNNNPVS